MFRGLNLVSLDKIPKYIALPKRVRIELQIIEIWGKWQETGSEIAQKGHMNPLELNLCKGYHG